MFHVKHKTLTILHKIPIEPSRATAQRDFFTDMIAISVKDKNERRVYAMKDLVLCVPEDAFRLEEGRYDLLSHNDGDSGAAGFFVNPDRTINTYHNFPTWTSVDRYQADAMELGRQIIFPCVVVKGE